MKMKLYEIENEIKAILDIEPDENGEMHIDYDALDGLEMEKAQKIENLIKYYKSVLRSVEAFKAEEKELSARRKTLENKSASLKTYLDSIHQGEKAEYGVHKISYRKSESVQGDIESLGDHSPYIKTSISADKTKIKKDLKADVVVPGWGIVTKMNIQIK
jgi:hypothetical protein